MKYKLIATLMAVLMLSMPVIGFWHPPPPPEIIPCTYMGTLINGEMQYNFTEPVDGYCEDFHVTVYVANVTDLYGYDFVVDYDSHYFNLVSWTVATDIWAAQAIIFNGTPPLPPIPGMGLYEQVVTALPPSTGVTGDFQLADLVFHIQNDACPPFPAAGYFSVYAKLSNSCSGVITTCQPLWASWFFLPVISTMWIEPAEVVNSIVGDKFTVSVLLKDAVLMTDFLAAITWDMFYHTEACNLTGLWSTILTTDIESVVLNTALFNASTAEIIVYSPPCGTYSSININGGVGVMADTNDGLILNLTYPSETVWLFNVTFTKCDVWYCGAQPLYTIDRENHVYTVQNASTPLYLNGAISSLCEYPSLTTTNGLFTFAPVPGDLDGSGHVDIADLMIEAQYYGLAGDCTLPTWAPSNGFPIFYDLNRDGIIDIYDIVVVAKNFCRTTP